LTSKQISSYQTMFKLRV